jgi:hypothetical protein
MKADRTAAIPTLVLRGERPWYSSRSTSTI